MKLFQRFLVASTAVSLISPVAAQATETINLDGMSSYARSESKARRFDNKSFVNEVNEKISTLNGRVDGLEARQNNFEAGSFSDTTTLDGKAIFTMGAVNYDDASVTNSEAVQAYYSYTMNLNTSFTGDDNLYIRLKSGNALDWAKTTTYGTYLTSAKANGDALKVDKIWYEFPIGEKNTVWIGPKIENYYMHGTTPSLYKPVTKQFTLGGNGHAYGASTDTGAGWAYKADNGFALSSNIGTKSNSSCRVAAHPCTASSGSYVNTGLLTAESKTSWATQIGFTKPRYSASAILNVKSNGWSDSYYSAGDVNGDAAARSDMTSVGLRGWWRPEDSGTAVPSISVGYDTTEYDTASDDQSSSNAYFVGLNWNDIFQADDKIGIAFGQPTTNESSDNDPFAYEVYYSFKPNDSMTITPAFFGGSDRNDTAAGDITGAVIETTFKF